MARQKRQTVVMEHEYRVSEVEKGVVALLNVAVVADGAATCQMCGLHDDAHTSDCLVPSLEDWLERQYR